jgi:hypothetical protein
MTQAKGLIVNDDRALEQEADKIGEQIVSGAGASLTPSSGDTAATSTITSLAQPIECKNKIDSFTAPQVEDPIDILHGESQNYYKTNEVSEVYILNQTPLTPASLPLPIAAIHPQPKRVTKLKAILDGAHKEGSGSGQYSDRLRAF